MRVLHLIKNSPLFLRSESHEERSGLRQAYVLLDRSLWRSWENHVAAAVAGETFANLSVSRTAS
jgi:hypothetical protein